MARRKDIPHAVWLSVVDAAGWKCQRCGIALSVTVADGRAALRAPDFPHVDHIVPLARGGTDERSNLQALCARCNKSKRDKT